MTAEEAIELLAPLVDVDPEDVCSFAVVVYRHQDHRPLVAAPMDVEAAAQFLGRTALVMMGEEV